jgi:hypothetical protein
LRDGDRLRDTVFGNKTVGFVIASSVTQAVSRAAKPQARAMLLNEKCLFMLI